MGVKISKSAQKFIQDLGITDVTFKLVELDIRGAKAPFFNFEKRL